MPNKVSEDVEEQILNFVQEYPTYGPERTEAELKSMITKLPKLLLTL